MKKKVTLRRIFHRDAGRIAIYFSYDEVLRSAVKKIAGVQYSGTHKCFYINDDEEDIGHLLSVLRPLADIDMEQIKDQSRGGFTNTKAEQDRTKDFRGRVTDSEDFPMTVRKKTRSVEFRINESSGSLVVKLPIPYSPEWISELKSYRGYRYDNVDREWIFPWSKLTTDSLADYFSSKGINIEIKKEAAVTAGIDRRRKAGDEIRDRPIGTKALDYLEYLGNYLDDQRYSPRTREAYMSMMEFFFRYFSERDPSTIDGEEISEFIHEVIIKQGYSAAYHNQMISAIKTCYSVRGSGQIEIKVPGRPRRSRALPKTFSKEEVIRILNSQVNIKHKLLLWMIYSCGLRRSEAINVKLRDLDRDRSILHIREGKGMVDRIVPVPGKVWQKIDEYLAGYSPRIYLFEGQTGGKYSSESVYRVFRQALRKSGIKKEVGVHSLRHSYATHLHESGLDIRYIQELLGHKSTRTTEIYTHVSRRNLIQVRSPIEDMDVK